MLDAGWTFDSGHLGRTLNPSPARLFELPLGYSVRISISVRQFVQAHQRSG